MSYDLDAPQFRARVLQGKLVLAQAFGSDLDAVWAEGDHYLMQYAGESPSELQVCEKRKGRWRLIGGSVATRTLALPRQEVPA